MDVARRLWLGEHLPVREVVEWRVDVRLGEGIEQWKGSDETVEIVVLYGRSAHQPWPSQTI